MKILIAVLSLNDNGGTYSKFYKAQKETWDSVKVDGVDTYYYFGNGKTNQIIGNDIITDISEGLMNCGHKTLKLFELIKHINFDILFRTNSSSYVDKSLLKKFLENKPKTNHYSGAIGVHHGITFASGCGYAISKNLILKILENKNLWNHTLIDDVSIADLIFKFGISPEKNDRYDVGLGQNIPPNYFHYRLKTKENRNHDIDNMYKIFKLKNKWIS